MMEEEGGKEKGMDAGGGSSSLLDEELAFLLQQEEEVELNTLDWEEAHPLEGMPEISQAMQQRQKSNDQRSPEEFKNAAKEVLYFYFFYIIFW